MEKINKKIIADSIAGSFNLTKKESLEIIDNIFDIMSKALEENKQIDITGFGKFEVRERNGRLGINPNTQERLMIESSKVPSFRASKVLKKKIN